MSDPRKVTHFNDGVIIDDFDINMMIHEVLDSINNGKTHNCMSRGDTSVAGFRWTTEIEILIATSSGRSTYRFYIGESMDFEYYRRPVLCDALNL